LTRDHIKAALRLAAQRLAGERIAPIT